MASELQFGSILSVRNPCLQRLSHFEMVFIKLLGIPGPRLKQALARSAPIPISVNPGVTTPDELETFVRQLCHLKPEAALQWVNPAKGTMYGVPAFEYVTLPTVLSQLSQPSGPDPGFFGD